MSDFIILLAMDILGMIDQGALNDLYESAKIALREYRRHDIYKYKYNRKR